MKEPVDARISFAGFLASLAGLAYLAVRWHADPPLLTAMSVYGLSLVVLFGASSLYHGVRTDARTTEVLRKVDHASIYALIAGSYTPVLVVGLTGAWRVATLAAVWALALTGIALTIWFVNAPRWLSTPLYVALGWYAVVPAYKLIVALPVAVTATIALGGVLYTTGALIYASKHLDFMPRRFGFHEVFHLFVLAGATAQFIAIGFLMVPHGT